jgi:hypothetical protein
MTRLGLRARLRAVGAIGEEGTPRVEGRSSFRPLGREKGRGRRASSRDRRRRVSDDDDGRGEPGWGARFGQSGIRAKERGRITYHSADTEKGGKERDKNCNVYRGTRRTACGPVRKEKKGRTRMRSVPPSASLLLNDCRFDAVLLVDRAREGERGRVDRDEKRASEVGGVVVGGGGGRIGARDTRREASQYGQFLFSVRIGQLWIPEG